MASEFEFTKMMQRLKESQQSQSASFDQEKKELLQEISEAMEKRVTLGDVVESSSKSLVKSVLSSIPSPQDALGAIVDANPILSSGAKLFKMLTPDTDKAKEERNKPLQSLIDQVDALTVQLEQPPEVDEPQPVELANPPVFDATKLEDINMWQLDVLTDLYEVWAGAEHSLRDIVKYERRMADLALEADREDDRSDLRQHGTSEPTVALPGWDDAVKLPDDNPLENAIDDIIGSVIGNNLGKLGAIAVGLKTMTKRALKFLGPVGAIASTLYSFYEGFSDPEKVLGREADGIADSVQAGLVNIVGEIAGIVDWVAGLVGFELNAEGYAKDLAIQVTDSFRGIINNGLSLVSAIGEGVTDTAYKLRQEASELADDAVNVAGGAKDYMTAIVTSLVDGVTLWLKDLLESMTDLPVVGKYVQEALDKLDSMTTVTEVDPDKTVDTNLREIDAAEKEAKRRDEAGDNQYTKPQQTVIQTNQSNSVSSLNYNSSQLNSHNDEPTRAASGPQLVPVHGMY